MSRPVHTYRGDLVIVEPCGCRHDGRSYIPTHKSDEGKLGMCEPHRAEHADTHQLAALEHRNNNEENKS